MTLNCCTFEFSRNFASIRRRVLYYDSPGSACRALTFALVRLSCIVLCCIVVLLTRWDTEVGGTVLSSQFLSLSTRLPSRYIYGFGENVHKTFRHDLNYRTWGMFARDEIVGHEVS